MGRISKGILGGFAGIVGTVVGGSWRGIDYMRSRAARKKSYKFSQTQLEQQAKFRIAAKFIRSMNSLLQDSFGDIAVRMTGANNALRYTLENAITGTYPTYTIDYSKVLVSRGTLLNAGNATATAAGSGKVTFTWTDNSGINDATATDIAILVVYCPTMNLAIYTMAGGARSAGTGTLDTSYFTGKQVETYIGFVSDDGSLIAESLYTGQVTVS